MKTIRLTRGKVALVDDEDFDFVNQFKWHASKQKGRWYAHHRLGKRGYLLAMHRLILDAKQGNEVDHRGWRRIEQSKIQYSRRHESSKRASEKNKIKGGNQSISWR